MSGIRLASRLSNVRTSPTVAISARAKELIAAGKDVISLAAGEPDFDTPKNISDAALVAIKNGETHYTLPEGLVELREAICQKLSIENNLIYRPDQVIVGAGGKQILFNALMATLEAGDEVIIPAPYWVSYPDIVRLFAAEPVIIQAHQEANFKITAAQLESAITDKTRWLILNSPSNPTGAVYSQEEFSALGAVLEKYPQVWVISDDIYEKIVFDDIEFISFAEAAPNIKARTLTLNGLSKSYAMTGWRIGYGAGDAKLITAMKKIQGQSTLHPCSIAQWAAVEAFSGPQEILTEMCESFAKRRKSTLTILNAILGLSCFNPQGAFYLFISIESLLGKPRADGKQLATDVEWAAELLEQQGVATVPGSAFGANGYIRLSFATSEYELEKACQRIKKFCETF